MRLLPGSGSPAGMPRGALPAVMLGYNALAALRKHGEQPLTPDQRVAYISISVSLVLLAGLMSGLTLGLMSLDMVDLEVLKRSGTAREQRYAAAIAPLVSSTHFLLVTLLLCNAGAMEALPLFLDRLADPVTAIIISVTAVLLFGEIIPQAVCTRYGLAIGYYCSWFVRLLMLVTSPISWPISKLLDALLGHESRAVFRRTQLKALVDIHGADEGLGGNLTSDEVKVICGALDLTAKTARQSMTPLSKMFMLSSSDRLDLDTMRLVLESGHSRIPVFAGGDPHNILGLILVKELLAYRTADQVPVSELRMRSLPRLPADTPMYDLLKLFQMGRSHMAVLTDPSGGHPPTPAAAEGATTRVAADESSVQREASASRANDGVGAAAEEGVPVGIITIEDVIEELMQAEIVDETDLYVDNERLIRVEGHRLPQSLPSKLRAALRDDRLLLPSASGHAQASTLQTAASGGALVSVRKAPIVKSTAPSREGTTHGNQLLQPLLGSLRAAEPRSV